MHQVQAVEVAPGKLLVSLGQDALCRKLMLFDVNWLYKSTRESDFSDGLDQWSAFQYLKGIVGHCCYNRKEQALLVPHPDLPNKQVMRNTYREDPSLVQDNQGAVWNFPAARNGFVTLRMKLPEGSQTVDLILNDRWFNPTDSAAKHQCMYTLPLNRARLGVNDHAWHEVTIRWRKNQSATVAVDNKECGTLPVTSHTEHGISYLHLLGGKISDDAGIWIERVKAGR